MALLNLIDQITAEIDNKNITVGIFIDLLRAGCSTHRLTHRLANQRLTLTIDSQEN